VKVKPLLACLFTVTTTIPVVAPVGNGATVTLVAGWSPAFVMDALNFLMKGALGWSFSRIGRRRNPRTGNPFARRAQGDRASLSAIPARRPPFHLLGLERARREYGGIHRLARRGGKAAGRPAGAHVSSAKGPEASVHPGAQKV